MKVDVLNENGEKTGEIDLPENVFNVKLNNDLVWQVIVSYLANKRQPIAHTKTRSEVRGGGKKPWRQKGVGRARHGSIRSPIFKGGGVVFGPRNEKVYKKKVNKKMKKKALCMILSEKLRKNLIKVMDGLKLNETKTRLMKKILEKLGCPKSSLIVLPKEERNIYLASRNIPKVKAIGVQNLNPLLLLEYRYLILTKEAIEKIKDLVKSK